MINSIISLTKKRKEMIQFIIFVIKSIVSSIDKKVLRNDLTTFLKLESRYLKGQHLQCLIVFMYNTNLKTLFIIVVKL